MLPPGFSLENVIRNVDNNFCNVRGDLPHLLILRGPVGSGKKTLAERHKVSDRFVSISTDDYFEHGKIQFEGEMLEEAKMQCLYDVKLNLNLGNNVVLHDTLITLQELLPYLMLRHMAQVTVWKLGTQFCPDVAVDALTVKNQKELYEPYYLEDEVRLFVATGIVCKMAKNKFTGKKNLMPISL